MNLKVITSWTDRVENSIGDIIEFLGRLENYEPSRLNLSQDTQSFFDSVVINYSSRENGHYLKFMNALFPPETQSFYCTISIETLGRRVADSKQVVSPKPLEDNSSQSNPSNSHSASLKRKCDSEENEYLKLYMFYFYQPN